MHTWERLKEGLAEDIGAILGKNSASAADFSVPPNQEFGDLSLPLFSLAKKTGRTPNEASSAILNGLQFGQVITGAKAMGPYLNFFINKGYLAENVIAEIKKEKEEYGRNKNGRRAKVVLEFSNGNTHKEYHIGHLRNICYGDAVTKILAANGYEAIPVSYINDFGIHVAKTIWWLLNDKNPDGGRAFLGSEKAKSIKNRGFFLGSTYARSCQEEKDDPTATQIIGGIMGEIESRKGEYYEAWKETRQWSIEYFDDIYRELGISFREIFYENEHVEAGLKIIEKLLEKGILKKSEGAIIADLEEYGLAVLVLVRSNGTAAYPVADLALAEAKFKKFHPQRSLYVVDVRQSLYFKQLFKIIEASGFKAENIHLPYDFVKLPSGMMSSRTGNVITYDEIKSEILSKGEAETRQRHDEWDEEKIKSNAKKIGLGAVKFEMLKVGAKSIITFDIEKALSLEGFTSAYIQYSLARINSIFRKNKTLEVKSKEADFSKLNDSREIALVKKLAAYPEIVIAAGQNYDPSEIAKYAYELAQMFNDYYHAVTVLQAEDEVKNTRLELLAAISQVVKNGLGLLGIETVEEM